MADVSVTAANVGMTTTAPGKRTVIYGDTVTEGEVLYLKAADGKYYRAINTGEATAQAVGIALTPGVDGDRGEIAISGNINCGATVAVGVPYYLSATLGGYRVYTELAPGDHTTLIGWGVTTEELRIAIVKTDLEIA